MTSSESERERASSSSDEDSRQSQESFARSYSSRGRIGSGKTPLFTVAAASVLLYSGLKRSVCVESSVSYGEDSGDASYGEDSGDALNGSEDDLSETVESVTDAENSDDFVSESISDLLSRCAAFKSSLQVSFEQQVELETATRGQALNPQWLEARRNRITTSVFADVVKRRPTTLVDPLVKRILGYTEVPSWLPAIQWGQENEPVALTDYLQVQRQRGHRGIRVTECGLFVDIEKGWLGASPDGLVHDPSCAGHPDGVLEIKCPFSIRTGSVSTAAQSKGFYCHWKNGELQLKHTHKYYYQIQGQMAITDRKWCDFVVWTEKDIFIERINYKPYFWREECLPKLESFYDNCVLPEIVAPRVPLGLPVLDLR